MRAISQEEDHAHFDARLEKYRATIDARQTLAQKRYHQMIDRAGLRDIFGKEVSRDLLARLR